jgi:hypothetical protein
MNRIKTPECSVKGKWMKSVLGLNISSKTHQTSWSGFKNVSKKRYSWNWNYWKSNGSAYNAWASFTVAAKRFNRTISKRKCNIHSRLPLLTKQPNEFLTALRRSHCISVSVNFRIGECRPTDIGRVVWALLRVDRVAHVICRMYGSKRRGYSIIDTPQIHVPHSSYPKANSYSCSHWKPKCTRRPDSVPATHYVTGMW